METLLNYYATENRFCRNLRGRNLNSQSQQLLKQGHIVKPVGYRGIIQRTNMMEEIKGQENK